MPSRPRSFALCLAALVVATSGCGRVTTTQRLAGKWIGRPETAAQRAERQSPKPLLTPSEELARKEMVGEPIDDANAPEPSDLEAFDVQISLTLHLDGAAEMGYADAQPIAGTWRVLSNEAGEIALQITALRPTPGADLPQREQRRFLAELIEDDRALVMHEEGADPQFGSLRFERVGE